MECGGRRCSYTTWRVVWSVNDMSVKDVGMRLILSLLSVLVESFGMSIVGRTRACDGTVARAVMVSHNRKVVVETRKKKGKRV